MLKINVLLFVELVLLSGMEWCTPPRYRKPPAKCETESVKKGQGVRNYQLVNVDTLSLFAHLPPHFDTVQNSILLD